MSNQPTYGPTVYGPPAPPLLVELHDLHEQLRAAGLTCQLYSHHHVLLIGTAGGGIITAGIDLTRGTWWANGVTGCHTRDLTGPSVTAAVHAEITRHRDLAAGAEHQEALRVDDLTTIKAAS